MMAASDFNLQKQDEPEKGPPIRKYNPEGKHRQTSEGLNILAQVSTLAWNLVTPIVGGVLLGTYIDKRFEGGNTWTLSLLVLGVLIAFSNLYSLYVEHGRRPLKNNANKKEEDEETLDKEE